MVERSDGQVVDVDPNGSPPVRGIVLRVVLEGRTRGSGLGKKAWEVQNEK